MLDLCRENAVRLVVPTIDTELPTYAAHRGEFSAIGTTVAISAPETIAIGGDKNRTHEWLVANGFPTVRQTTPDRLRSGADDPGEFPFPLLVKPRGGSASIGVAVVRDPPEMAMATRSGSFIVQTVARGVEHTVDVLVDRQGKCRCAVPRKRIEVRAGEVSKAVTVRHDGMMDLARRIAEALPGAYGVLNIQLFLDEASGGLEVIEINPRFGGGFPLAWKAGADYPRWLLQEISGAPSEAAWGGWRDRLVMLRYDEAVFVDAEEAGL
jgi:carbamoyl-phosphate synthase large subunit